MAAADDRFTLAVTAPSMSADTLIEANGNVQLRLLTSKSGLLCGHYNGSGIANLLPLPSPIHREEFKLSTELNTILYLRHATSISIPPYHQCCHTYIVAS